MSSYLFSGQLDLSTVGETSRGLTQGSEVYVILVAISDHSVNEFSSPLDIAC